MNQLSSTLPGHRQAWALEDIDCRYTQSSAKPKGRIFVFGLSRRSRETLTPIYTSPRQRIIFFALKRLHFLRRSTCRSTKTGLGYVGRSTTMARSLLVHNTTKCTSCAKRSSTRLAKKSNASRPARGFCLCFQKSIVSRFSRPSRVFCPSLSKRPWTRKILPTLSHFATNTQVKS